MLARYYHRYARHLTRHGFNVLTYDYRGIGASKPESLRGCSYRWRHWGERDFDAALTFMHTRDPSKPLMVVGHSIGGFLPGLAPRAPLIHRMLTVGAQYAWCGDYAPRERLGLILKWHVAMPVITALSGYFPDKSSAGWKTCPPVSPTNGAFAGPSSSAATRARERADVLARMSAVTAPILAVSLSDDEFGTVPAIRRTLRYYTGAPRTAVALQPADYGLSRIGHFDLFHDRHASGFWLDTLLWLRDGHNPWPEHVVGL